MKRMQRWSIGIIVLSIAVVGCRAVSAQDKYNVHVPNGIAFSDFKGYESWEVVSISQTESFLAVIVANPMMIDAYKAGIPGNGKHFPDGSKIAKFHWTPTKSTEAPAPTSVPDVLANVDFIERDSERFPDSGGWGYAQFNYDAVSDTFTSEGSGSDCGHACHTAVAAKDYIFTGYQKR
jgi:hypothetical protein